MLRRTLLVLTVLAALSTLPACFDETVKPIKESPAGTWPDMTREDDVIWALVWCYANPSSGDAMTRYESLLHPDYFFRLAAGDVEPGGSQVITRPGDIAVTREIFERQTELFLSIAAAGAWFDETEIGGAPCSGCMSTTRHYFIRAQFGQGETIWMSPPDGAHVTIVVAPDVDDDSKWVIRAVYDLGI